LKSLIWDVETTDLDLRVRAYQLKNYIKYFDPKVIERDWTMLGAAWMWLNDDNAQAISVTAESPLDDYGVIKTLHGVLNEADLLIGHNSDAFDIKKFNTRAIYYDLPPIKPLRTVDTLKIAKKYFKFTSNKLSYICNYLKLEMKDESPDWVKCIDGDADELRYMRKYNKQDVIATRDLYVKLRSFHHTHPKAPKVKDIEGNYVVACPKCSSTNYVRNGTRTLNSGRRRQEYQCQDCNGYFTGDLLK